MPGDGVDPELRELAGGEPELGDLDALYAGVRERIELDDRMPGARLRALPTSSRRTLAVAVISVFVLGGSFALARPHLAQRSGPALGLTLGVMGALMLVSALMCLRSVHRRALPDWTMPAWVAGALAGLMVLHLWSAESDGTAGALHGLPCLGAGLMLGLPVYVVLRVLDRGGTGQAVAAAVAAGVGGNLLLELYCPVRGAAHLVVGHVGVLLLFIALHRLRAMTRRVAD